MPIGEGTVLMNNQEITRRRLYCQALTTPNFETPAEVVSHLGAVQSQDYAGAKWALGMRMKDAVDSDIDRAFNDGSILRTHLLRPTWHFVTPQDIRWMLMLTAPRVHAVNAYYYRKTGVDAVTAKRSNKVIANALRGGNFLTRAELASALEKAGISTSEDLQLTYLVMHAELDGVICSGPRKGKQFTYALLDERSPQAMEMKRADALAELVRRYFKTRGPATLQDFCWWSGLTMADAKIGMEMVHPELASEEVNHQIYWFYDSVTPGRKQTSRAYLLPNYDEYFIGLKDRSAIGEYASQANVAPEDPALLAHIIIMNGQIIGSWKRTLAKNEVSIETSHIKKVNEAEKKLIHQAAVRFGKFLGLSVKLINKDFNNEQRKTRSL